MAFSFKQFLAGIRIVPKTTSSTSQAGDLDFDTTANKLNLHNGTTSSPVVTEAHAAVVTNKSINGATNTLTNLPAAAITGAVVIANGGTGQITQLLAFDALSPTTTKGDVIANNGTNNVRIPIGTDGQTLVADSSQTVGLKWSQISGIKNYILNSDAEATTNGYVTYADAAGALPVDGIGGSPTVTFTRSTSSPLRGTGSFLLTKDAANRQGEGASYDFSIDSADKAKVLQITFDYAVNSGTYADSDLTCYIYDVTNSQLIQPAGFTIQNATVNMKQSATFQSNSNSTSYRLIFHVASVSAIAYTIKMDSIVIGPQIVTNGTINTDPKLATMSFDADNITNTGSSTGYTHREGGELVVRFDCSFGGGGTAAGVTHLTIPGNLTIDTNKLVASLTQGIGVGEFFTAAGIRHPMTIAYSSPTKVFFIVPAAINSAGYVDGSTITSGSAMGGTFKVPIVGWASNVQVSSDTDTRVVAARYYGSNTSAIVGTVTLTQPSIGYDTHNSYNTSTGNYTVPVAGIYRVSALWQANAINFSTSQIMTLLLRKNGVDQIGNLGVLVGNGTAEYYDVRGSDSVQCVAGDIINIGLRSDVAGACTSNSYFTIERISGPSIVAASESVNAQIVLSSNLAVTSGNPIIFNSKIGDTHSAYNTSTGLYTIPVSGKYNVNLVCAVTSGSTTVFLAKNGTSSAVLMTAVATGYSLGAGTISCNAGDTISIVSNSSLTFSGSTLPYVCHAEIERIGN